MEEAAALSSEMQEDDAAVLAVGAAEEAGLFAALAELDDGVVAEAEAVGEVADGGRLGRAGDLEEELVLLRMKAGAAGGVFTEVEEEAELVAEVGEGG